MNSRDRIYQIIQRLKSGESFTASSLANDYKVSQRTILRDLNERINHLKIIRKNGVYFLDQNDIYNEADLLKLFGFKNIENILKNINKSTTKINQSYEFIDDNIFLLIQNAIKHKNNLEFLYKQKQRIISPYQIINNDGKWYLIGLEDDKLKHFSLSLIKLLRLNGTTFHFNKNIISKLNNSNLKWISNHEFTAKLLVSKQAVYYIKRNNKNLKIEEIYQNGDILITLGASFEDEILNLVKSYIPFIKIIKPKELNDKLLDELKIYISSFNLA